ncbi:YidH family protein [Methylocystis sp. JAN1]|uniref:YidH family protein n=1 Tax=Methylocystis sp. JAN1 TaxID=3397211 RepID=UPI003FA25FBC
MIRDYANLAANERTFLAWIRTGVAIIALGFVIERFNLFLLAMATEAGAATTTLPGFHRLSSPTGRYGGMALVGAGVLLIAVATIRFLHTARLLEDEVAHRPQKTHATLVLLSGVVLCVAAFSAYLAIG